MSIILSKCYYSIGTKLSILLASIFINISWTLIAFFGWVLTTIFQIDKLYFCLPSSRFSTWFLKIIQLLKSLTYPPVAIPMQIKFEFLYYDVVRADSNKFSVFTFQENIRTVDYGEICRRTRQRRDFHTLGCLFERADGREIQSENCWFVDNTIWPRNFSSVFVGWVCTLWFNCDSFSYEIFVVNFVEFWLWRIA